MREIKFRAWCSGKHNNMTFSKPHMEFNVAVVNGEYASFEMSDLHGTYETVPLMQFTGLLDKEGVEIYEGDIVKWHNNHVIEINWNDIATPHWSGLPDTRLNDVGGDRRDCEVIGNIHQNPELLK